jgi:hypothetical protein
VSAEQWQLSLRQLYGTADALEARARAIPTPVATPAPFVVATVPEAGPDVAPSGRATTRLLVSAAVHSALTVGVLLGGFALIDPVLPHPGRPHLADEVVPMGPSIADGAIPPSAASQP